MTALTRDAAGHLAEAIARLRTDWQAPGILAALEKAIQRPDKPDAWQVLIATARYAANPTNRTPGALHLDGQHWRPANPDEGPKATPTAPALDTLRCPHCGFLRVRGEMHTCGKIADPHAGADAARAALNAARADLAAHTTDTEEASDG